VPGPFRRKGTIDIDTHEPNHIAVAITLRGTRLGGMTILAGPRVSRPENKGLQIRQDQSFWHQRHRLLRRGTVTILLAKGHTRVDVMRAQAVFRHLFAPPLPEQQAT